MNALKISGNVWHKTFLLSRPSIGLSFFRIAVALTTGLHVIPSFFHLPENYFKTAFKTFNLNFFPAGIIDLVQKSPDALVVFFVVLFCLSFLFFFVGLFSQVSCIVMTACCYYFYALNAFHIGTLSWDILLVTLFLMCVTPYHGDYFSLDCLRKGDPEAYKRQRPFFLQRLLQLQIASTFFYTALYKITAEGNWLTGNPIYCLVNYPSQGVTKDFLLKVFLAGHPQLCYVTGIMIVLTELLIPFLLFIRRTRCLAIYLGVAFHVMLILTLDVPAIFFFLFPAQLLLFINPEHAVKFIEKKRRLHADGKKALVIYDGQCRFCVASVRQLQIMDLWGCLTMVDYHSKNENLSALHPELTAEKAASQLCLVEPEGDLWGGFFAFRRLAWKLPMLYPLLPVLYFPGMDWLGPLAYRWIAKNRYLLHRNKTCSNNACFRIKSS